MIATLEPADSGGRPTVAREAPRLGDPVVPAGIAPVASARVVGDWRLTGRPAGAGTLRLTAPGDWQFVAGCAALLGRWQADEGSGDLVLASQVRTSTGCRPDPLVTSLQQAHGIGLDGPDLTLFTLDGRILATFEPA
jgi:hypothetical protein